MSSTIQNPSELVESLHLRLELAAALIQAEHAHQALQETIRYICQLTGWEYGRGSLVSPDKSQPLTQWVVWMPTGEDNISQASFIPFYSMDIPVRGSSGAILEFASGSDYELTTELKETLLEVSKQLGKTIERIQAFDHLRDRELHMHQLVESVKDFAFYSLDLDGNITSWNPGAEKVKGYRESEIIGKNFSLFYTPQALAEKKPQHTLESARLNGRFDIEDWRVRKDGSLFWAEVVVFPIYDSSGILQGYSKITRDLTKRKLLEEELQESQARLKVETAELRRRLMEGREAERLHMAQELHDGPIQELYGLIFGIDAIRSRIRSQSALDQMEEMKQLLQRVVSTLRGLIGNLRPPTLAPFGLEKAIRSHIQIFQEAHPELQIELDLDSDRRTLPEDVRLVLYRIYQSSLTNVVRHAEASRVKISFKVDDEKVWLEIEDNGKGFMVPDRWINLVRDGHLGLVGAQERAEAIGGTFEVVSRPGEGTSIKVLIPKEVFDPIAKEKPGM